MSALKTAMEGDDLAAISSAVDRVNEVMQQVGSAMYANATPEADQASSAGADEDIVEGEVIDEDEQK